MSATRPFIKVSGDRTMRKENCNHGFLVSIIAKRTETFTVGIRTRFVDYIFTFRQLLRYPAFPNNNSNHIGDSRFSC